uniref:6-phosphogluconolactonase-like isoform X2 n=1 Tax=Oncorhynchus gorbuscha TaxID=8017 RepID=UPI001EAEF062|nr:6-phosphogluconolactonase-like isoform X2 [Oncorhynchus gorbuscha]
MALQSYFTCTTVDTITTCIVRMSGRRVVVFSSAAELGPALAHLVASRADKALLDHGQFSLGLSGGSLVSMLSKELPALPDLDCSHWLVGFCDDRLVPFDDGESTYGLHKNQLFSKINIPDSGVLAIDSSSSVQECAEDYACKLKEYLQCCLWQRQFTES